MTLAHRLLIFGLAMMMTSALVLATIELPSLLAHMLVPPLAAWLHSLTPVQLALFKGVGYSFPGLTAVMAALVAAVRNPRKPTPPAENRWPPATRADPFRTRSGHGA